MPNVKLDGPLTLTEAKGELTEYIEKARKACLEQYSNCVGTVSQKLDAKWYLDVVGEAQKLLDALPDYDRLLFDIRSLLLVVREALVEHTPQSELNKCPVCSEVVLDVRDMLALLCDVKHYKPEGEE